MTGLFISKTLQEVLAETEGSIKTGPFGTMLKASEYSRIGTPLISVGEIGDGKILVHEKTPRVSPLVTTRLPEYLLREDDLVFARKGGVDRTARVKDSEQGFFLGSDGIRVRFPSTICPRFVAYQLQTSRLKNWLLQHAGGSTMASLNQGTIGRIELLLPPLPLQCQIASTLASFDSLIDVCNEIAATLRYLCETLVAFSQGKEESTWMPLGDVFNFIEGRNSIKTTRLKNGRYPVMGANGVMARSDNFNSENPTVVLGKIGSAGALNTTTGRSWITNNAFEVVSRQNWSRETTLSLLKQIDFQALVGGSANPYMPKENFVSSKVLVPRDISGVSDWGTAAGQAIDELVAEAEQVTKVKYELLPLLVDGSICHKEIAT